MQDKDRLTGFKEMSAFLKTYDGLSIHHDTLRRAVTDERNPLPVEWDGYRAFIKPLALIKWRDGRKGIRRASGKAA